MHISDSSPVADHCSTFSLSDPSDADLKQSCSHVHNETCDQCTSLALALRDIEKLLTEVLFASEDDRDEAFYLFQSAKLAILSWKCHLLRSVKQDQARLDALSLLNEGTVPSDWFGKRGISWHISVAYRRVEGQLQSQGFVTVIKSCGQGSSAVVTILQHVIRTLKTEHPEIQRVFLRQDNAGCYHSASTVLACPASEASTGVRVEGLDFSDPQGGKGTAGRSATTAKSHIRLYINEGNDVTTAQQMQDALLSHGGIEGVRVAVADSVEDSAACDLPKITGISKLNNFRFDDGKLLAWRAYAVGSGKLLNVAIDTGRKVK